MLKDTSSAKKTLVSLTNGAEVALKEVREKYNISEDDFKKSKIGYIDSMSERDTLVFKDDEVVIFKPGLPADPFFNEWRK